MRIKIKFLFLGQDRIPSEITPCRLFQILQARLIHCEKDKCIPEEPWRVAAGLEDSFGSHLGSVALLLAVGMLYPQHDQSRIRVIRHVLPGLRKRMNAMEITSLAQVEAQPFIEFLRNRVWVALKLFGAILSQFRNCRLSRVPIPNPILVEIGCCRTQSPQRVTEDSRLLSRHHAANPNAPA